MQLQGKVALITGAASGIGYESALLFAKEGASVVAVDVNDPAGTETVAGNHRGRRRGRVCACRRFADRRLSKHDRYRRANLRETGRAFQ